MLPFDENFFRPEDQKRFWAAVKPEMNLCFGYLEKTEDWTAQGEVLDALQHGLAEALPKLAAMSAITPQGGAKQVLFPLITLLARAPLRISLASLAWLDRAALELDGEKPGEKAGWGLAIYILCKKHGDQNSDPEIGPCMRLMRDRIELSLRMDIAADLFSADLAWQSENKGKGQA